jgi:hypothetical protein
VATRTPEARGDGKEGGGGSVGFVLLRGTTTLEFSGNPISAHSTSNDWSILRSDIEAESGAPIQCIETQSMAMDWFRPQTRFVHLMRASVVQSASPPALTSAALWLMMVAVELVMPTSTPVVSATIRPQLVPITQDVLPARSAVVLEAAPQSVRPALPSVPTSAVAPMVVVAPVMPT